MPRELRQIVFSSAEFMHAVAAYDRMSQQPIISGQVVACRLEENEPVQTTSRIVQNGESTDFTTELDPAFLRRALVRYCIENNIMIPREGEKKVAVRKGRIALVIKLPPELTLKR